MANRSDNFNRADESVSGTLGTPSDSSGAYTYNATAAWLIASNTAGMALGGNIATAALDAGAANAEVQVTIATTGNNGYFGLCARYVDTSNYLVAIQIVGGGLYIYRMTSGSLVQLGSYSSTPANGDVLKFVVDGNDISAYLNGTLRIGPITETQGNTSTLHGLFGYADGVVRFDDLTITDLGGGGGSAVPKILQLMMGA